MSAIALDPLIAEAQRRSRRRRNRWAAAAVVVVVLAGASLGGWAARSGGRDSFVLGSPGSVSHVMARVDIAAARGQRNVDFVDSSDGVTWVSAEGRGGMWLTSNQGRSWRAAGTRSAAAFVATVHVDRRHGWMSGIDGIDRTTDGGRTWQHVIPPGCAHTCEGFSLSFLDARHGFAIAGGSAPNNFFRTGDGGVTWQLVSRPSISSGQPISFVNHAEGFGGHGIQPELYWGPTIGDLYRTIDGGRTWSPYTISGSDSPVEFPIRSFGRTVVLVQNGECGSNCLDENPGTVWVSRDAGAHWVGHPIPLPTARSDYPGLVSSVSVVSPHVWFFALGRQLWTTTDGGAHWRAISVQGLPSHEGISKISFTSSRAGWAILPVAQYRETLFRTTDGGRHWAAAGPPKPKRRAHR